MLFPLYLERLTPFVLRFQGHNINPRLVADAVPVLARPWHALRHRRVRAVRRERERLPGEERDGGADHRPLQVLHSTLSWASFYAFHNALTIFMICPGR